MYSRNQTIDRIQLAVLDAAAVFVSVLLATWLRHGLGLFAPGDASAGVPWTEYLFPAVLTAIVFVLLFFNSGLYHERRRERGSEILALVKDCAIGTMAVLTLTFFYRGYSYSRLTALFFVPVCLGLLLLARHIYRAYSSAVLSSGGAARRVILVGFGPAGRRLALTLTHAPAYYRLLGVVSTPEDTAPVPHDLPCLGASDNLRRILSEHPVDEVLIAMPSASRESVLEMMAECIRSRTKWKLVPDMYDLVLERLHIDEVGGVPLIGLRGNSIVGFNWAMKRAFDLAFAAAVLFLLSPVFVLIALAVKLTSHGPVLFRQVRIGHNGRAFEFLKFRSMYVKNDATVHQQYTADWIYGQVTPDGSAAMQAAVYKIVSDPRVTPVGRVLRRTSMDELPQFWNVLRGEMSVVGPRPPLPYEVERYTEWHKRRLDVLPGITGLWQVSGRNALSFEEMIRLDICYIENWSIRQDLSIVWRTIPAMLLGKAY